MGFIAANADNTEVAGNGNIFGRILFLVPYCLAGQLDNVHVDGHNMSFAAFLAYVLFTKLFARVPERTYSTESIGQRA